MALRVLGAADEETRDELYAAEDDSWWDKGLFTLLIVGGVVLFLFPEPGTSMVGILLVLAGVVGWLIDALTGIGT